MKTNKSTKKIDLNNTLIVTADIGKFNHYGYYRCPDGNDVTSFVFRNNLTGFTSFWKKVEHIQKEKRLKAIVFGYESTGSYGVPLVHFLKKKNVQLRLVNPAHTKRLKELQDNSPNKTDQKDPRVIADIVQLGRGLTPVIPEGKVAELRYLIQSREQILKSKNRITNQMESIITQFFPEFLVLMKGISSKSSLYLLTHYPTAESITQLGQEELTSILRKVSRYQLGEERAMALYDAAGNTVGIKEGIVGMQQSLKIYLEQLDLLNTQQQVLVEEITKCLKHISYTKILMSLKGIGIITAAVLISEVGDFKWYCKSREIIKLAGLNLYEISSGIHKGQTRISKRGRPLLRQKLYFLALNLVKKGCLMHERYQTYLKRGMKKPQALTAVVRKLIMIIFAMVRDEQPFIEKYNETQKAA
jgi:transposase